MKNLEVDVEHPPIKETRMQTSPEALTAAELLALCMELLDRAERSLHLLPVIEAEVLALMTNASREGLCSRLVLNRIEARLIFLRRLAFAMAERPNYGPGRG